MFHFLKSLLRGSPSVQSDIEWVNQRRAELSKFPDNELKAAGERAHELLEIVAVTAVVAARLLGLVMFDVQLQGALALARGKIAEMQTGEGKTLAACRQLWLCQGGARGPRDDGERLSGPARCQMDGSRSTSSSASRWAASSKAWALRSASAPTRATSLTPPPTRWGSTIFATSLPCIQARQVHRPFAVAVMDEADSFLIDEARVPLVIAGGESEQAPLVHRVDRLVRRFRLVASLHSLDEYGRNVGLTDAGIQAVENAFRCGNLYAEENLPLLTAVQNSLHAHALLRRDVDYLVKNGAIESVDEFKGRIVRERRWPAGLHTAIEVKEGVAPKAQGRILGSITMENLIALYPKVCGMTGTAATQAEEFRSIYGLEVEVIPTNRPVIRVDHPDVLFQTKLEKERAVIEEIRRAHQAGRPVLVGTVSVEESERLSAGLQRYSAPSLECPQRGEGSGDHCPRRRTWSGDHFDEHGRTRDGHPAWEGRRRTGRIVRHRDQPARKPPHRQPTSRPRRAARGPGRFSILHLARRRSAGQIRHRSIPGSTMIRKASSD